VSGVTVCVLALVTLQPGTVGNTLLLTRMEKDNPPVTVQIPTAQNKVGLLDQGPTLDLGGLLGVHILWLRDGNHWVGQDLTPLLPQFTLSLALREFDAIQKDQKENSSCTDKRAWWTGRLALDHRMEVCATRVSILRPAPGMIQGKSMSSPEEVQVIAELLQVLSRSVGLNKNLCHLGRTLNKSPS
jgi:separase